MLEIGTPFSAAGKKALLLGSGELGKEVTIELQRYGVVVVALDKYAGAPAMHVADKAITVSMLDGDAIRRIVEEERPDYIIPEIEAIATPTLIALGRRGWNVVPTAAATFTTMNRREIRTLAAEKPDCPRRYSLCPYGRGIPCRRCRNRIPLCGQTCDEFQRPRPESAKNPDGVESAWREAQEGGPCRTR